jgi:hypothetical protein
MGALLMNDDPRVQALLDKQEIHEVLARYARGCDRVWPELMASVYHEGSWDSHGSFEGPGSAFARLPSRRGPENVVCHHALCQEYVELDGDVARCETYFICTWRRREDRGPVIAQLYGRYLDRFERREGIWRIAARRVVVDASEERPDDHPWPPAAEFLPGARWPDDAVFHFDELVRQPASSR